MPRIITLLGVVAIGLLGGCNDADRPKNQHGAAPNLLNPWRLDAISGPREIQLAIPSAHCRNAKPPLIREVRVRETVSAIYIGVITVSRDKGAIGTNCPGRFTVLRRRVTLSRPIAGRRLFDVSREPPEQRRLRNDT